MGEGVKKWSSQVLWRRQWDKPRGEQSGNIRWGQGAYATAHQSTWRVSRTSHRCAQGGTPEVLAQNSSAETITPVPPKRESNSPTLKGSQPQWLASSEQNTANATLPDFWGQGIKATQLQPGSLAVEPAAMLWGSPGHTERPHVVLQPTEQHRTKQPASHPQSHEWTSLQMTPDPTFKPPPHDTKWSRDEPSPHWAQPKLQIHKQNKHYCFKLLILEVHYYTAKDNWNTCSLQ